MALVNDTVGGLLNHWAEVSPNKNFISYTERNLHWTYDQFNKRVDQFAKGLMELGVTEGSKVGIWANNVPDWLTVFFASAKIGAWLVTVNTNYKVAELEYLMKNADIHTMCIIDHWRDSDYVDMIRQLAPEISQETRKCIHAQKLPELRNVVVLGSESYDGMYNTSEVLALGDKTDDVRFQKRFAATNCHEVVNMQYTSGTTGFPKGVMLTHHNIVNNGLAIGDAMKFTEAENLLICVPLFHCFGIVLALMAVLTHGASMTLTEDFDAKKVLTSIEKERCTALYGVPTMFSLELSLPEFSSFDLTSLRTGIMAGSVCPIELMKKVMDKMHMKDIISVYGLTESSPGMTMSRIEHSAEQRATTVGTEFPHVEVRIVNPETNTECNIGENGEICCRGYNVMKGYYKNEEATFQTIDAEGWLHSGDVAMKDADGFYHITGRMKDMIIRGGENIYPREIENYIYQMPEVNMVEIVGVPDPKYGEIVVGFVILNDGCSLTEDDVREFCKSRISRFKVPKYVFFVDTYPKTGSGKVQKYKLRELGAEYVAKRKAEEAAAKK
ncbi:MAG: AMP-binding protein [Marinilabiliaceae bacterium]|nr:AMP-binding protein [Marinilabiliaceae bacterium]